MRAFFVCRARIAAGNGAQESMQPTRGMMLVEHDVEAELVGDDVLVEIAIVEVGADLRIEQPVRDRHPRVLASSPAAGDPDMAFP